MPAKSVAQRQAIAIAEHNPGELYARNAGLANMSHEQLHDFAATPEKGLPKYALGSKKSTPKPPKAPASNYGLSKRSKVI